MREKLKIFILLCLTVNFLFVQNSFGEEKKVGFVKTAWRKILNIFKNPVKELTPLPITPKPEAKPEELPLPAPHPKESPLAELSMEELRDRIKYMLETMPEAADFIPELKIALDKDGNLVKIECSIDGILTPLEKIDSKETLIRIHNRIANERTRMQTERIQMQLEATRAAQQPPRIYTPPAIPQTPTPPPTPPKVYTPPAPPAAPPRR